MTKTIKLSAYITDPRSNSYGYAGSPIVVDLTNQADFIREETNSKVTELHWPVLPGQRQTRRPRHYKLPMKEITSNIIIRGNSPAGLLWKLEGVNIPNPNQPLHLKKSQR